MAGITQDKSGNWKIDDGFLTPERTEILARLDKEHQAEKSKRKPR